MAKYEKLTDKIQTLERLINLKKYLDTDGGIYIKFYHMITWKTEEVWPKVTRKPLVYLITIQELPGDNIQPRFFGSKMNRGSSLIWHHVKQFIFLIFLIHEQIRT